MKPFRNALHRSGSAVLSVSLVLWLAACARDVSPPSLVSIRYEMRTLEETLRDCPENLAPCASIVLRFPELIAGPSATARESIDAQIQEMILAPIDEESRDETPQALMERFIRGYQDFADEFPESSSQWYMTREIEPIYDTDRVFSVQMTEESYTGGAHPNSNVWLASFDVHTGQRLALDDVLMDGHEAELQAIGERAFRDARGLGAEDDLTEAGFWFDEGVFRLNENFAVTAEGLRFVFNRYEVAPYALGATEIVLPVAALRPLARAGGVLAERKPARSG